MKRKARRIGFAAAGGLLLAAGLLFVALALFRSPSWPPDTIYVPRDASTLHEALDRVEPGGTIVMDEGSVSLSGPIRVEVPGITLAGQGAGAQLVFEEAAPALAIVADEVSIQNLQIVSSGVGILLEASDGRLDQIEVSGTSIGVQLLGARGNRLSDISMRECHVGLELVTSDGNAFFDLAISSAEEAGIRILGSWENRFEQIRITDAGEGVVLEEGAAENTLSAIDVDRVEDAAIRVSASNENMIQQTTIRASNLGVVIERSTGTVVRQCQIETVESIGISLMQALQNRIEQNSISGFTEAGIQLGQSHENALLSNRIAQASGIGIVLNQSNQCLVKGNDIREVPVGLRLDEATASRLLRNTVADCSDASIILLNGNENRLLDNVFVQSRIGLLLEGGADNTILRNQLQEHTEAAILIGSAASRTRVLSNEIRMNTHGLLMSGSGRAEILDNVLSENTVGLQLVLPAAGLRIEANLFERNETGLDLVAEPLKLASDVEDWLGFRLGDVSAPYAVPVLTNNTFAQNTTLDIHTTTLPLYAAGNWWGKDAIRDASVARVSDSVDLQESAWVGTLALGTESDPAQILLGRLLQLVLEDAGYRVLDLIGMGNGPRMQHALRTGDVDLVWWTGPEDEPSSWVIEPIPAPEGWIAVVGEPLAAELTDPSIRALAERSASTGQRWVIAVPGAFGEEAMARFVSAYELDGAIEAISWTQTLEEAETLLKFGAADFALVGSLEETVTRSGFSRLADPLGALEFGEIAAVLRVHLADAAPEIREMIKRLGARLTADVLHDLMGRVRLMHMSPMDVATEFLKQEGLLAE